MTKKVNKPTDCGADVQTVSEAVSRRIKQHRKSQKISLDELSRRAGVSKGMLVEIEKGAANPSIAILCKLAAALGLSVADIVNVASAPAAYLIASQDMPTLWTGDAGGSARLLAGTSGPNMIEMWRWEMFPGERYESSGHPQAPSNCCMSSKASLAWGSTMPNFSSPKATRPSPKPMVGTITPTRATTSWCSP